MSAFEDIQFVESVISSARGEISTDQQSELTKQVDEEPSKKAVQSETLVFRELLILCEAADAPAAPTPIHVSALFREHLAQKQRANHAMPIWRRFTKSPTLLVAIAAVVMVGWFVVNDSKEYDSKVEYAVAHNKLKKVVSLGFDQKAEDQPDGFVQKVLRAKGEIKELSNDAERNAWEKNWSNSDEHPVFKVLLQEAGLMAEFKDKIIGELIIQGRWRGAEYYKRIEINSNDNQLEEALRQAELFIRQSIDGEEVQ